VLGDGLPADEGNRRASEERPYSRKFLPHAAILLPKAGARAHEAGTIVQNHDGDPRTC